MTENKIPKLPVPPASWKLEGARSTSQPESAAQAMQALDGLESEIAQATADRGLWGAPEYAEFGMCERSAKRALGNAVGYVAGVAYAKIGIARKMLADRFLATNRWGRR